jgi:AraC-like DNA-binding protein
MSGGGTRGFSDVGDYEASLHQLQIKAGLVFRGTFRARLTWAELHHIQILRCEEDVARVAYVQFAPGRTFITLAAYSGPPAVWRGTELAAGDIIFHNRGERLHHSLPDGCVWNVISADPAQLERYGSVLSGKPFQSPPEGQVLRPLPRLAARLRRLHTQACRLAQSNSKLLSHPEVAHSIEQELIQALVACLTTAKVRTGETVVRDRAAIMARFEEVLAQYPNQPPTIPEISDLIGVSVPILRSCCAQFACMSPTRYVLLRRLREVRNALLHPDSDAGNVAEIAQRFGFAKAAHLGRAYHATFGEAPSTTLQRALESRFAGS